MAILQKKKIKYPIALLTIFAIIFGMVYFVFLKPQKVEAAWYDFSWFYRQAVTITVTSSSSDVSNLDTWFSMSTSALVSASKMQSDCDDLRFTNANGKLLPYYIDSGCNTTATKIWVKADLVPKNSTTYTVYAYYGNPNAVAASDSTKFNLYNGLVGYWNMNEASWNTTASEVKDLSVNANNGTGAGNATTTTGKYGNGGTFDGTGDYADVGDLGISHTSGATTMGFWMKTSDVTQSKIPISYGTVSGGGGQRILNCHLSSVTSGKLACGVASSSGWQNYDSNALSNNIWYHFVLVNDIANAKIYFYQNGVLLNSGGTSYTGTFTDPDKLRIGDYILGSYSLNGLLDDLRIYNRALSASEVSQLYSDGTSSILTAVQGQSVPSVSFATEEKGPAPVAYWKFDEGQGQTAYDDFSNNNDGTLGSTAGSDANDPIWQTGDMCVSGKCLKFDGSTSYVDAGNGASLQFTNKLTLEMWLKPNAIGQSDTSILDRWWTGTRSWKLRYESDSKLDFIISTTGADTAAVSGTSALTANQWQHIAVVYDGSNATFYRNGVSDGSPALSGSIYNNGGNLHVGDSIDGASFFNGFMDDVKIYPYARTAAQIKTDYNSRNSTSGTSAQIGNESAWMTNGLVGYWKMDESSWSGVASEVVDSSGTGNNGVRAGNATTAGGKFGNGGTFDGTGDYVTISSVTAAEPLTVAFWAKPSDITTSQILFGTSCAGPQVYLSGGNWQMDHCGVGATGATGGATISQWQHVVAVFESASIRKIYVNGALQATNTVSNSDTTTFTRIGSRTDGNAYNGLMDETRVYNRALSPKEVADLYSFAPGPVGYWKMDDPSTGSGQAKIDSSTYGNTGTTYSANGTGMNCKIIGKYGGGCLFDGTDDYVLKTSPSGLATGNSPMSIGYWAKISAVSNLVIPVFYGDSGLASNANFWVGFSSSLIYTSFSGGANEISQSWTPQLSRWYYLAGTWDGTTLKTYIDGVLYDSGTGFTPNTQSDVVLIGGLYPYDTNYQFNGSIDDVKIYNYARTQKQIMEDMNAGHPAVGSPVGSYAGYWRFDEGYGTSAKDMSVNANTGTITGATWNNNGKFGKALAFDGADDLVNFGKPTPLNITGNITVEAWIKPNSLGGGSLGRITDKGGYIDFRTVATSTVSFIVLVGGVEKIATAPANSITFGSWAHVVGVFNGTNVLVYVNSVATTGNATAGPIDTNSSENFNVGNRTALDRGFDGLIDEVKVYPFALTASDIQTEYNRGSALQMGSVSTDSTGAIADNSSARSYCIPGDTTSCASPVGEWNFNEKVSGDAQTLYDTSGNGNNGTSVDGANNTGMSCKIPGKYGSACQFDGTDDYVTATKQSFITYNGIYTLEMWINPSVSADSQVVFQNSGGDADRNSLGLNAAGTSITFGYFTTDYTVKSGSVTPGTWNHIVGVNNSGSLSLFINGVSQTGTTNNITMRGGTAYLYLGITSSSEQPFKGSIDDVKIFNYARTAAQVAWDYNRGKPVGWWKFDECQGLTAYDSSGNSNTGTITIGATGSQTTAGTCNTPTDATGAWYNGLTGKMNSALSFDGTDDYVQLSDTGAGSSINFTSQDFTIGMWFKSALTTGYGLLFDRGQDAVGGYNLSVTSDGSVSFSTRQIGATQTTSATGFSANTWWHLVVIRQGATVKIYRNGIDVTSTSGTHINSTSYTVAARIGVWSHTLADFFKGLIDEAKIYNYALTPAQIKLDYNQGAAVRFGPSTGSP